LPAIHGRIRFEDVYEDYFNEVSRWVRALGGPEDEREDLTQDVFLVVHRRLADFDGQNLPGWLYQIARRRVRDCRLRWFRLSLGRGLADDAFIVATGADPESALRLKESEAILNRLLSRLPDAQRAAFVLFEIEEYSGEEIARIQSVPVNTVWARIHSARQKLLIHLARVNKTSSPGNLR
jgi:RNA polymerase sigma-70 factor (ECF subfamily)